MRQQTSNSRPHAISYLSVMAAIFVIMLVVGSAVFNSWPSLLQMRTIANKTDEPSSEGRTSSSDDLLAAQQELEKLQILQESMKLTRAVTRSRLAQHQRLADAIDTDLRLLDVELPRWHAQFTELLTSDAGRRVVVVGGYLDILSSLDGKSLPDEIEVASWRSQLSDLRTPLDEFAENVTTGMTVPPIYGDELAALRNVVRQTVETLRQDRTVMNVIVRDVAHVDPGDMTLRAALDAKYQAEEQALVERLGEVRRTAEEAANQRLEQEQRILVELESEVRMLQAEADQQRVSQEIEALSIENAAKEAEAERIAARARLVAEMQADMAEIETLLTPFIRDGEKHPEGIGFFKLTGELGPVSLTGLRGTGGLIESEEGLKALYLAGGDSRNDRPLGSFPEYHGGHQKSDSDVRRRVTRARELLIKYGDLMVDQGLLAE